jgi:hypothetical protein
MVTAIVVATGVLLVGPAVTTVSPFPPWWMVALVLGLCAATSSSLPPDPTRPSHDVAARLDVQDYPLPIVFGGVLLAFLREPTPAAALLVAAQATLIAVVIAIAGWLLLSQASTPAEQRVCIFASLLFSAAPPTTSRCRPCSSGPLPARAGDLRRRGARAYPSRRRACQHSLLVPILPFARPRGFVAGCADLSIAYVIVRQVENSRRMARDALVGSHSTEQRSS